VFRDWLVDRMSDVKLDGKEAAPEAGAGAPRLIGMEPVSLPASGAYSEGSS